MNLDFKPGDYVKLKLAQFRELEGTILESYDKSIVLLKLGSGYNIGIAKEKILGSRILKKFKAEEKKYEKPDVKGKPAIGLVVTGGTIASKLDSRTGGVKPLTDVNEFAKFYPKLFDKVNVKVIEVPFMMASESMTSEHWKKIAKSVKKMLDDDEIKGVVVTHGTDFLHYTASALSFMFKNLNKPVVLTYSQRSVDRASSDAQLNLECAANFALSDCAEVVLVGHASSDDDFCWALSGTKVKKMHSSKRDAFKPINTSPLAKVWSDKIEFLRQRRPRNKEKVELDDKFSDKVALVKFYPGQKSDVLDFYKSQGYKGIIFEASGLGHLPVSEAKHSWVSSLKKCIKDGMFVGITTQCVYGRVDEYVYSNLRELGKTGVVFLEDMLSETAFVKLSWVLGHRGWNTLDKIKAKMLENISREFNELLTE